MTDEDIIKLAQTFNVRKTWAEVAAENVSYKFDALGFGRAVQAEAVKHHVPISDDGTSVFIDGMGEVPLQFATSPADSRAAFEAHFGLTLRQALRTQDGSAYQMSNIQERWDGWMAAMRTRLL